jgi:phage-related protein
VLAAIAIAAILIIANWDKVWPFLVEVWNRVTEAARNFMESNKEFFDEVILKAQEIWGELLLLGESIWNRMKEIWETVWNAMLTFWDVWGERIMTTINTVWGIIQGIIMSAMGALGAAIKFFTAIFNGDWQAAWDAFVEYFGFIWDIIQGLGKIALELLKTAFAIAWDAIKNVAAKAWDGIKAVLSAAWNFIKDTAISIWNGILDFFMGIWNSIVGTAKDTIEGNGGLLEFFQLLPGRIIEAIFTLLGLAVEWAGKVIGSMLEGFIGAIPEMFVFLKELPGRMVALFVGMLTLMWNIGWQILKGLWNGLVWLWQNGILGWLVALPGLILAAPGNLIMLLLGVGKTIMRGLWNGIKWIWNNLILFWIKDIKNKVVTGIGNLGSILLQAGKDIINGLWNGMKNAWSSVSGWVADKAGWIGRKFSSVLGMFSPSKVMMEIGRKTMEGFEIGLRQGMATAERRLEGLLAAQLAAEAAARTVAASTVDPRLLDFRAGTTNTQTIQVDVQTDADPEEIAAQIGWTVRIN